MGRIRYDLLVLDIDGTLLNKNKRIDLEVYHSIMLYQQYGGKVILASGRSPNSTKWMSKVLNTNEAIIAFNGSYVEDCAGNVITYNRILEEDVFDILLLCQKYNLETIIYTSKNMYIEWISELNTRWLNDVLSFDYLKLDYSLPDISNYLPNIIIKKFQSDFSNVNTKDVLKIVILPNEIKGFDIVGSQLEETKKFELNKTPRYIEVTQSNSDKCDALIKICKMEKIDLKNVMAVGDNYNDLKMIQAVGFGVAMENGVDLVKQSANKIVTSNDNLGVKEAIELYGYNSGIIEV